MAIIVKLDDILYDRRMTLTECAGRIDITLANLSILKTGGVGSPKLANGLCSGFCRHWKQGSAPRKRKPRRYPACHHAPLGT